MRGSIPSAVIFVPLQQRFLNTADRIVAERLPGWKMFVSSDIEAARWIADQEFKIRRALETDDELLLERALATWRRAWERVNERVADAYIEGCPDPAAWDLRFFKWTTRIIYIKFSSPMGEFYIVPRRVPSELDSKRVYTVSQIIAMLHPTVASAIMLFGQLPALTDDVPPCRDEKHLTIDFTGETTIKYRLP